MYKLKNIIPVLILSVFSSGVFAQSIIVLGGNQKAQECYTNSTVVGSRAYVGNLADACDYALDYISLSVRDRAATLANRGIIRTHDDQFDAALSDFATALALRPNSAAIYVNRGNVFYHEKDFEQAVSDYSMAVDLDIEQLHIAHLDRAMAYNRLGNTAMAEEDYRQALAYKPSWELAETLLARLLARMAEDEAK